MSAREAFDVGLCVRTDGQIHDRPINLDAVCDADLRTAESHPALHDDVRAYARVLRTARELRIAGDIQGAMRLEQKCERIYNNDIPKALRW